MAQRYTNGSRLYRSRLHTEVGSSRLIVGQRVITEVQAAGGAIVISVPVGSLTITGQAPTIIAPVVVTPTVGAVTITGQVPVLDVTDNFARAPPVGSLTLTGQAPTIIGTIAVTLSGEVTASIDEDDIVAGTKTVIFTLVGDTFVSGTTSEDGIAAGSNSNKVGATKWDALIQPDLDNADVVLSAGNTVATITLPAYPTYDTDETEAVFWTIPAASLTLSLVPIAVSSPAYFTIDEASLRPEPAVGALTLTGLAPTVVVTDHHIIAPSAGSLALTGLAPTPIVTAAPILTLESVDSITDIQARVKVTTDQDDGILYRIIDQSPTKPSVAQIQIGHGSDDSLADFTGNTFVTFAGEHKVTTAILVQGTVYYFYAQHQNAGLDDSSVTDGVEFTTDDPTTIIVGAGSLALTGYAPTLTYDWVVKPDAGSLAITGLAPTIVVAEAIYGAISGNAVQRFTSAQNDVVIRLFDPITNDAIALDSAACVEMGSSGRYIWDTSKLTTQPTGGTQEYVYEMTDDAYTTIKEGIVTVYSATAAAQLADLFTRMDLDSTKPNTYNDDGSLIVNSDFTLTKSDNGDSTFDVTRTDT